MAAAAVKAAAEKGTKAVKKIARGQAVKAAKGKTRADKSERRERRARKKRKEERRKAAAKERRQERRRKASKKPRKPPKPSDRDAERAKTYKTRLAKRKRPPKPKRKKRRTKKEAARLSPKNAAEQLYSFAARTLARGEGHLLGVKGKPSPEVKRLQKNMGKIKADGFYGRRTRRRGKELLGRDFPIRKKGGVKRTPPKPPKPDTDEPGREDGADADERSAVQAAEVLLTHARNAPPLNEGRREWFGWKGHGNEVVEAAQEDMGGLVADGIYGRNTRNRGRELTGKLFPAR